MKITKGRLKKASGENQPKNSLWAIVKILLVMYGVTGIMLLILSVILWKLQCSESIISVGIIVTYILSGFIGGFMGERTWNGNNVVCGAAMGFCYFLILTIVFGVLDGFHIVLPRFVATLVLCVASGMLGGIISKRNKNARKR